MKPLSIFKSIKACLAREISELDDPRIPPDLTLTKIDFSRGYGKLDVYISSSLSRKKKTILHTMNIAKRRIVSRALSGLRLRKIPKLDFFWDDTVEKAFKINEILNKSLPND